MIQKNLNDHLHLTLNREDVMRVIWNYFRGSGLYKYIVDEQWGYDTFQRFFEDFGEVVDLESTNMRQATLLPLDTLSLLLAVLACASIHEDKDSVLYHYSRWLFDQSVKLLDCRVGPSTIDVARSLLMLHTYALKRSTTNHAKGIFHRVVQVAYELGLNRFDEETVTAPRVWLFLVIYIADQCVNPILLAQT